MDFQELVSWMFEISRYSGIPVIIVFLTLKNPSKLSTFTFTLILASFIADFSNYFFIRYIFKNSFIISNIWSIFNFSITCLLFLELLPQKRKSIIALLGVFLAGCLVSFLFFYSFLESNTFVWAYSSFATIILSLIAYYEILNAYPTETLSNYPVFWIVTGFFLYSTGVLFAGLFQNYVVFTLQMDWRFVSYLSFFILLFNILKNILFFYAFILIRKGFPQYIYAPNVNNK